MRSAYRILGHTVAGLVAVQAAAIAFAVFGLINWVDDGNSFTPQVSDDRAEGVTGSVGFMIHSFGALAIVLLSLILLIISFFAKVPSGSKWAGLLFGAAILQYAVGIFSFEAPALGLIHGLNAIAIAWLGWRAARQAQVTVEPAPQAAAVP